MTWAHYLESVSSVHHKIFIVEYEQSSMFCAYFRVSIALLPQKSWAIRQTYPDHAKCSTRWPAHLGISMPSLRQRTWIINKSIINVLLLRHSLRLRYADMAYIGETLLRKVHLQNSVDLFECVLVCEPWMISMWQVQSEKQQERPFLLYQWKACT